MKQWITAITAIMMLVSCSRPGPTSKSFPRSEILGEWTHRDARPETQSSTMQYTVRVSLREDGTFDQIIQVDGTIDELRNSGTWILTGSRINMMGILADDWDSKADKATWSKMDAEWWFVDWYDREQKVALFGGLNPDPDTFSPWTRKSKQAGH